MRTKRIAVIAAIVALASLVIGNVAARATGSPAPAGGEITDLYMSDSPDGPPLPHFLVGPQVVHIVPVGTDVVYVVLKYTNMEGEQYGIKVSDPFGGILLTQDISLTGSGTKSFEVRYYEDGDPVAFPTGKYVTNLYIGGIGGLPHKDCWWEVRHMVFLPLILRNY